MFEPISIAQIIEFATIFTVLGGVWHTIHKLKKDNREEKEAHQAEILQIAYEADTKIKLAIDTRIELILKDGEAKLAELRKDLDNFVKSFENEIEHITEKQAGEIRVLGEKIEDLRTELRTQHGQLIALVTKLVEKS